MIRRALWAFALVLVASPAAAQSEAQMDSLRAEATRSRAFIRGADTQLSKVIDMLARMEGQPIGEPVDTVAPTDTVAPPPAGVVPFFAETFAGGQRNNANGFAWTDAPYCDVSDAIARTGTHALRCSFGAGDDSWAEQRFVLGRNLRDLWLEYWMYLPDGTEGFSAAYAHRNSDGPDNNKMFRLYALSGDAETGQRTGASTNPGTDGESTFQFEWVRPTWPDGAIGTGGEGSTLGGAMLGAWTRVRVHAKASTAAQNDGVLQLWLGDSLVIDMRTVDQKYVAPGYWTGGYLLGYANSGFAAATRIFLDDIAFFDVNPGW